MNALPARALPLIAALLLPIACSGTEIDTSPSHETTMHETRSSATTLPSIDTEAPAEFETATFALG